MADPAQKLDEVEDSRRPARILVFGVDDGLFGIHLEWVRSVQPRGAATVHSARARKGRAQPFLLVGGQPAFVMDLRELLGLQDVLGSAERSHYVIVRSGSHLLALQADECLGVQELDLRAHTPVASNFFRDGGVSVGHLIDRDGTILAILDPNRLMDAGMREALEPAVREARGFVERQMRIDTLWTSLCREPTLPDLRNFARLAKRNGRNRTAAAAKTVLKLLEAGDRPADVPGEAVLQDLLRFATAGLSGELGLDRSGAPSGRLFLDAGRVVDAVFEREGGRRALRRILECKEGRLRVVSEGRVERPNRMTESTVALAVAALESIGEERRGRREK